jgi:hypothetical protein
MASHITSARNVAQALSPTVALPANPSSALFTWIPPMTLSSIETLDDEDLLEVHTLATVDESDKAPGILIDSDETLLGDFLAHQDDGEASLDDTDPDALAVDIQITWTLLVSNSPTPE